MDAELIFNTLLSNRKRLVQILDDTPESILSEVPEGFNNNIWWNVAHTLVVQQLLCYKLSGLPMHVEEGLIKTYSKGTFPGDLPGLQIRREVSQALVRTVDQLRADYTGGAFRSYQAYTTSAGVTLRTIEDGLHFNLYHEGLHMGTIQALLKVGRQG